LREIRGKTISYSSYKRKERDKIERDLLKDIDTLECNVKIPLFLLKYQIV
jgi:hypothetical protein